MRYETRLAKFVKRGSEIIDNPEGTPVAVLAAVGHLGTFEKASEAFNQMSKMYSWVGDQAAEIVQVPPTLMESVVLLNIHGASPAKIVEMLRSGHLGRWSRNGSLRSVFSAIRGSVPASVAGGPSRPRL